MSLEQHSSKKDESASRAVISGVQSFRDRSSGAKWYVSMEYRHEDRRVYLQQDTSSVVMRADPVGVGRAAVS